MQITYRYYNSWEDWAETIPRTLFRTLHEGSNFPVDEQAWSKTDQAWVPTTRVTESMFRGGDVEPTTEELARKHFPEAFAK